MFAMSLSILLSTLDYSIANVALPTIAANIHATPSDAVWVVNAYLLVGLIGLLPLAAAGDRWGHARICKIGLVLFIVASALCAVSDSLAALSAARALQGLGGACILSVNAALLRYIYPKAILGRGMALNALIVALGTALGPTVAATILSLAGWQWLFLINVPIGGIALIFSAISLPQTPLRNFRFDLPSTILLMISLAALVIGCDRFAHGSSGDLSPGLVVLGLVCFIPLVRRQLGRSDPLLPVDLLRLSGFRAAFVTGFTGFVASNFFMISMPFNLVDALHRPAATTGLLMSIWPVSIMLVAPIVGRLTDRHDAGLLSTAGLFVSSGGFLALWLMPAMPTDLDIAWRIAVAGGGFGFLQPPNNKAMIMTVPSDRTGSASGMISVARMLGQTIGAMLVALVFEFVPTAPATACLGFASLTAVAGALVSASRIRANKPA